MCDFLHTFLCSFTLTPGRPCWGGDVIGSERYGRVTVGAGECDNSVARSLPVL